MAAATRDGPSRLISTAWVSGVSNETFAAAWMTTPAEATGATRFVESESVLPDVPCDGVHPPRHLFVQLIAQLCLEAVEAVVLDHLAGEPRRRVCSAPGG